MTSPPPTPAAPWTTPPSQQHLEQVALARARSTKIRRAVLWATISAWTTAIFAGLTILSSLFSALGFALGVGMAVVAYFEFRGAGELKRLDRTAPKRMALNQVLFGILLFLYGAVSLWTSLHQPSEIASTVAADPELARMLPQNLEAMLYTLVYGTVMLAAILGPGPTAIYYYTRIKYITAYINETPAWILDLQRAGMSI